MRVLYVEDNALDADLVRRALDRGGRHHVLDVATTLTEARARLAGPEPFDLLLVDLQLPDGNGLDLLSEVRSQGTPLACVVLTSHGDEATAVAALKAGADDYQAKHPGFTTEIVRTLDAALARFRREVARRAGTLRVLYAEHHPADVDLTLRYLAQHAPHIRCEVVHSADDVLARLPLDAVARCDFDVLLLDYRLPGESALDLLKVIRLERDLTLPIIVVTGQGDEDVATQALRLGATDYLLKQPHYLLQLPIALESAHYHAALVRERDMLRVAADELRQMAARTASILESITDAFFSVDRDWRITYVNRETERAVQQPREMLVGRSAWEAFPESVGTILEAGARAAMAERRAHVFDDFLTPRGRWLEARAYPSDEGLAVYFRDVTDRRESERRIREQAALLDKAQDAIIVCDLEQRVTYWNCSAERLYGWTAQEAHGRPIRELVYRDDAGFARALAVLLDLGEWMGELAQVHRDGQPLVIEGRWTLVTDDQGKPQTMLLFNADVSERKRLESQFLRAQRMESLGTLAGGIAHDLNNVLAPIMLSIELLRLDETDPERLDLLSTVESSTRRGADMVTQVLSFARGVAGRRIGVAVGPLVHELQKFANETFPKSIVVRTVVPLNLWNVSGDPTQLLQVLLNLCVNARDAMPEGGTLTLTAANVELGVDDEAREPSAPAGPYVLIDVGDSGTGITPDVMDRLFEPFFTTKQPGKGTGLGLSTSLAIVKSHGGFLRVTSAPGSGSSFRVYLPAATIAETDTARPDMRDPPRGHDELVLVIDDEAAVREVTRQTLEAFGYRVVTADDGAEGVRLFTARREDVAVVLIDMMMPVMDGPAAVRALREIRPDVPVLAVSGVGLHAYTDGGTTSGITLFLHKPYSVETLLSGLAQVLSGPGAVATG